MKRTGTLVLALLACLASPPHARAGVSADGDVSADGAAAALLHVQLESSAPGRGEDLTAPPTELRLRFTGRIEPRYTSVTLTAPDGSQVPLGAIEFVDDREFTAATPPVTEPGVYTVRWRTAGADGHVLEGTFPFTLLIDPDAAAAAPAAGAGSAPSPQHGHDHGTLADASAPTSTGGEPGAVLARWLHFLALVLLLGGVSFSALLLPRLRATDAALAEMERKSWLAIAVAALLLAVAAVLRLWLQSAALHGADRAWDGALLSVMLADTSWGRAWLAQVVFFALLGAAILAASRGGTRGAVYIAVVAGVGLAAVPALSGHAGGGTGGAGSLAVAVDTLHVVGAGAWLGTLLMILLVLVPAMLRHEAAPGGAIADAIARFSPMALLAAGIVVTTGVINALLHIGAVSQLWQTAYGRALLVKLALVLGVAAAGFCNWRFVRPRLAADQGVRRLRVVGGVELAFSALVLLATAVLTGLPRP